MKQFYEVFPSLHCSRFFLSFILETHEKMNKLQECDMVVLCGPPCSERVQLYHHLFSSSHQMLSVGAPSESGSDGLSPSFHTLLKKAARKITSGQRIVIEGDFRTSKTRISLTEKITSLLAKTITAPRAGPPTIGCCLVLPRGGLLQMLWNNEWTQRLENESESSSLSYFSLDYLTEWSDEIEAIIHASILQATPTETASATFQIFEIDPSFLMLFGSSTSVLQKSCLPRTFEGFSSTFLSLSPLYFDQHPTPSPLPTLCSSGLIIEVQALFHFSHTWPPSIKWNHEPKIISEVIQEWLDYQDPPSFSLHARNSTRHQNSGNDTGSTPILKDSTKDQPSEKIDRQKYIIILIDEEELFTRFYLDNNSCDVHLPHGTSSPLQNSLPIHRKLEQYRQMVRNALDQLSLSSSVMYLSAGFDSQPPDYGFFRIDNLGMIAWAQKQHQLDLAHSLYISTDKYFPETMESSNRTHYVKASSLRESFSSPTVVSSFAISPTSTHSLVHSSARLSAPSSPSYLFSHEIEQIPGILHSHNSPPDPSRKNGSLLDCQRYSLTHYRMNCAGARAGMLCSCGADFFGFRSWPLPIRLRKFSFQRSDQLAFLREQELGRDLHSHSKDCQRPFIPPRENFEESFGLGKIYGGRVAPIINSQKEYNRTPDQGSKKTSPTTLGRTSRRILPELFNPLPLCTTLSSFPSPSSSSSSLRYRGSFSSPSLMLSPSNLRKSPPTFHREEDLPLKRVKLEFEGANVTNPPIEQLQEKKT